MAVMLVGLFGDAGNLFAGCARERHSVDEINMAQMTGFASGQLVLMPRCIRHYADGMFKITFAVPRKPCNGPFCHLPQPSRDNDFKTVADLPSRTSDVQIAQDIGNIKLTDPTESDSLPIYHSDYSSVSSSPLERPPISL